MENIEQYFKEDMWQLNLLLEACQLISLAVEDNQKDVEHNLEIQQISRA